MQDVTSIPGVIHRKPARPSPSSAAATLALDENFSEASSAALIAAVGDGQTLSFFDAEHPQRSDPGLYVSLQRSDGQLFVKGANHGWSYPCVPIDSERAARWLWLCRYENNGDGRYESSTMRLSSDLSIRPDPDPTAGTRFFDWLTTRLS